MARDDPSAGLHPTIPSKPTPFDDTLQNGITPSRIDNSSLILDSKSSQAISKILSSLGDKRSGGNSSLGGRVRDLFVSLASVGGIDERSSNPHNALFRAIDRIDEKQLRKNSSNDQLVDYVHHKLVLEDLDNTKIEILEDSPVVPVSISNPTEILNGLNLVSFDGGSAPIFNYSCSTVYARAGSFGYSQCTEKRRLSFESGINRLWCDAAINVASKPGILDNNVYQWTLDRAADDMYGELPLRDRVKRAELYLLSMVESAAVVLCLNEFRKQIDLVFIDGPQFVAKEGFDFSLTRMLALMRSKIPSISVVKNPSGSPIMRACGIKDTSDVVFFDYLRPGERSPLFIRHEEGFNQLPSERLKRVFWYFKSNPSLICRYEIPHWCYKRSKFDYDQLVAADAELNGGKMSFMISHADALVRVRRSLRLTLQSLQRAVFNEKGLDFLEPYNETRWRGW